MESKPALHSTAELQPLATRVFLFVTSSKLVLQPLNSSNLICGLC